MISRPHHNEFVDRDARLLLFVVNVDWFFLSHRLPIAVAARNAGLRVMVAAADTGRSSDIRAAGIDFVPLPFSRSGADLLYELRSVALLYKLYKRLRPDLIHHVTIKPVIYGSIAARMLSSIPVVNAISGLGYVFSQREQARQLRHIALRLYRFALRHPHSKVIFQNPDDIQVFRRHRIVREDQIVLIRGSGVDCAVFQPAPKPDGEPIVVLASRMLWDKGVGEFVEAARMLRREGVKARFVLVGDSDEGNPTAVPRDQLQRWHNEGVVEWWGYRSDMNRVFSAAHIAVLPTFYPEGLPKVLLEAAASGLPMVATNIPGCREIVRHGINGILVEPKNTAQLAEAIKRLIFDKELREQYGRRAREIAVAEFSLDLVVRQHLDLYSELLGMKLQPVSTAT